MGNNRVITQEQELILSLVRENEYIRNNYYFTGGTALALHYLQHRESIDLDFFNNKPVNQEVIISILQTWKKTHSFQLSTEFYEVVLRCNLTFDTSSLLVDFSYYPCHRIEKGTIIEGFEVDSLMDIAVNKLKCVKDRTNVKDFVDLYFLIKEKDISVWDLMEGVKIKFGDKLDPYIIATDFYKVNDFTELPKMIKPLKLEELKRFFRDKAKQLGKTVVE